MDQPDVGKALAELVRAGRRARGLTAQQGSAGCPSRGIHRVAEHCWAIAHPGSSHLVKHPVLGRIEALHVSLWSTSLGSFRRGSVSAAARRSLPFLPPLPMYGVLSTAPHFQHAGSERQWGASPKFTLPSQSTKPTFDTEGDAPWCLAVVLLS